MIQLEDDMDKQINSEQERDAEFTALRMNITELLLIPKLAENKLGADNNQAAVRGRGMKKVCKEVRKQRHGKMTIKGTDYRDVKPTLRKQ